MSEYHIPVLFEQSLSHLISDPSGVYADATFGGGGHTAGILSRLAPEGRVIAFDRDSDAIMNRIEDSRLILIRNNFRFIHNYVLHEAHEGNIPQPALDGVLADLGVSSHQFDTAERGFSFRYDAPLDMRMNTEAEVTAADIVNGYSREGLERILRLYGEVDNPRKTAGLIVNARDAKAIMTTGELVNVLQPVLPKFGDHKVLAKIYQALRIEVNQEMRSLEKFLQGASDSLKPGGRLVIITYHSLEDRMVKNFMKTGNVAGEDRRDFYGRSDNPLTVITRKPVLPEEAEIASNTRARSAKLRVAEKKGGCDGR